ncbi:hypothetical protein PM082_019291 [Marasmius tenuissimus]|nr:hypothetical protein PM082_019291 [Marasmius tenuissimus]
MAQGFTSFGRIAENAQNTTTPVTLTPMNFDFQLAFSKPPSTAANEPRPLPCTPYTISTPAHTSGTVQGAAGTVPSLTKVELSLNVPRSTVSAVPSISSASRSSGSAAPSVSGAPRSSGSVTAHPR